MPFASFVAAFVVICYVYVYSIIPGLPLILCSRSRLRLFVLPVITRSLVVVYSRLPFCVYGHGCFLFD